MMISGNILNPPRLQKIDDLVRRDHFYLESSDECYYWGEYSARQGYSYSETNSLILNFKKSLTKHSLPEWQYKERAIDTISAIFRVIFQPRMFASTTLIPVPPSKSKSHPEYDDRLFRLLQKIGEGRNADIRELVVQTQSREAAHQSDDRPRPQDLEVIYKIDETLSRPDPGNIIVFDDVLTTGCHFKAMQKVLNHQFPNAQIFGVFIARCLHDTDYDF
jgi:hypothetical protein